MNDLEKSKPWLWLLLLVFTIIWFYTLGVRTLVPTDEGRYAQMAREMVASGDWITTRLNGIKYFEKPPLQTWMNAVTFTLFGLGDWQARFWTGLCGFFGVMLVAFTGQKVFNGRTGLYAGLILGSSLLWNALGHINTLDMGLSAMMTLALCALLIAQDDKATHNERRNWMLVCWLGMALAVLSKGLIGLVLPGAVLVLYTGLARDWAIWKRLHLGKGLLLFFAVTTPWFVMVSMRNPEFAHFFFIHEHFQRFLTKTHHREGPWYYFFPLLVIGIMPWLGVLIQSLVNGVRKAQGADATGPAQAFKPGVMLVIWACFIFFFFSISGSKLPSYILPIMPALALLVAVYMERAAVKAWYAAAGLMLAVGVVGFGFSFKVGQMSKNVLEAPLYQAYQPWVTAGALATVAGALLAIWASRRKQRDMAALALAISGFLSGQVLIIGHDPLGHYVSGLPMVPAINAELTPTTPLYMVGMYNQTLPYYLRRTVTLVEHPDEFEFGLKQQPELWMPNRATFMEKWTNGPKAVAITTPDRYAELVKSGLPMRIITRDSRRIVITNDIMKK